MIPNELVIKSGEFVAYPIMIDLAPLRRGQRERDWMDCTANQFAYRCLPLTIANQLGWDVLNPVEFWAYWTGGVGVGDVVIRMAQYGTPIVTNEFGNGVITFHIPYLFRTPGGINLWAKGTPNSPKDAVYPLEGVVETDWSSAKFTMNWIFTRPYCWVRFAAGEPICRVIPIPRYLTEMLKPEVRGMIQDPVLHERYTAWSQSRMQFIQGLLWADPDVRKRQWQKDYFKGQDVGENESRTYHQTKLNQGEFK
jgi:hypothetical protein